MQTNTKEPVTATRLRVDSSPSPAPRRKLLLSADVKNEYTPKSKAGSFDFLPLASSSPTIFDNLREFLTAQPQKKAETGNVVLARVGSEEKTAEGKKVVSVT